jgi:hypothetical protein
MINQDTLSGMVAVETAKTVESKPIHCPVCGRGVSGTKQIQPCKHVVAMFDDWGEYVSLRVRDSWRRWEGSSEAWALEHFPDPRFLKMKLTFGGPDHGGAGEGLLVVFDWAAKESNSSDGAVNASAHVASYSSSIHF